MAHTGLFIKNISNSIEFYHNIFGFEVISRLDLSDGTKIAMIQKSDCMIELVQLPEYENYCDGYFNHIAFEVEDIEKAQKEMEKLGIEFEMEEPVYRKEILDGVKFLMFRGPDGEHLEIDEVL